MQNNQNQNFKAIALYRQIFFRINALLKVKWPDFTNEKRVKRFNFTDYKIPICKVISKEFDQYFLFSFA